MEIIDYKLKVNPETSVNVLAEYGKKADGLINTALEGDPKKLIEVVSEHPYLSNPGVLARTMALVKEKSKRLQDIVYLRICQWGNQRRINGGNLSQEVLQMDSNLIQKIEWLEACRD